MADTDSGSSASASSAAADLTDSSSRRFHLSAISDNPNGWGPHAGSLPSHLLGLPFMPFNKNEKLSRISDWNFSRGAANAHRPEEDEVQREDDDGGAFSIVDNKPKLKPKYQSYKPFKRFAPANNATNAIANSRNATKTVLGRSNIGGGQQTAAPNSGWANVSRQPNAARGNLSQRNPVAGGASKSMGQNKSSAQQRKNYPGGFDQKEARVSSVEVSDSWRLDRDIELSELSGVTFEPLGVEDLEFAGSLSQYNPAFSRIAPRNPVNLQRFENRQFFTASTNEDPILTKYIQAKSATVYATEAILSLLMASPRSVNSWDILLSKSADGELIFDKRQSSRLDYLSVNENYNEALTSDKESINHPDHLTIEATVINHNFTQQSLLANKRHDFEQPNPFIESLAKGNEPAQVGFRYRKWDLGAGVSLIARTSLDGFVDKKGDDENKSYIISRALNEFDPKLTGSIDWRQKLETQTGAVLASEMKNNQFKLARWASEASLSGADEFRLGFVSRLNPKNSFKHSILMTKQYSPSTFADSVNIKVKTLWGALKVLIDRCLTLKEGRYLLLRDPLKPTIHIYAIPNEAFEAEDSQNDGTNAENNQE